MSWLVQRNGDGIDKSRRSRNASVMSHLSDLELQLSVHLVVVDKLALRRQRRQRQLQLVRSLRPEYECDHGSQRYKLTRNPPGGCLSTLRIVWHRLGTELARAGSDRTAL